MEGEGATYGNHICGDVNCYGTLNGNDYKNGESWCYYDTEGNENTATVGSRHYRHICYMGEEMVEPCADFRNEVCVEDEIEIDSSITSDSRVFAQAGCSVNRFQDCIIQNTSQDCLNSDKRDCIWIPIEAIKSALTGEKIKIDAERILAEALNVRMADEELGRCVPQVAPGFEFWESGAENDCNVGTITCVVKYEKGLLGGEKAVENEWCEKPETVAVLTTYCSMLGDCGPKSNYIGKTTNEGYEIIIGKEGDEEPEGKSIASEPASNPEFSGSSGGEFSTSATTGSQPATTASVVRDLFRGAFGK